MIAPYLQIAGALADKVITNEHAARMMEYQNDYNSPKNQIARMHAAGLSPWNYDGSGNTSAQPVYNTSGSLSEAFGQATSNRIAERQVQVQEKLADAQIKQADSQSQLNQSVANTNNLLLKYLDRKEEATIRGISASAAESEKRTSRYDEQVNQEIMTQKSQEVLNYANSERADADVKRINELLDHEVNKMIADTEQVRANIGVLKTQANLNNAELLNVTSMFVKNMEEVDTIGLENWMLKYQKSIIENTGIKPGTPPWTALTDMFARIRHDLGKKTSNPGSW